MARLRMPLVWLLAAGSALGSAAVTASTMMMGKATLTSSSSSSSSTSSSSSATSKSSGRSAGAQHPQPSITQLVQEYAIPNGHAVKTTELIHGQGISRFSENMRIIQTKKKEMFSSTSTSKIGDSLPVTATVTSNTNDGSRVKVTVGQGKEKIELKALPAFQFDVNKLTASLFNSSPSDKTDEALVILNDEIDKVAQKIDDVFKTTYYSATEEFDKEKKEANRSFADASKRFKTMGLKYPEFQLAY